MKLAQISIKNFRNHRETRLEFGDAVNVLSGGNGEGKTNVLEAICYFALAKSFYSAGDPTTLKIGEEAFELDGRIHSGSGGEHRITIRYSAKTGEKSIAINRVPLERLHSLIGRFPVVLLSPESERIISGPPGERRKFLDLVLSQQSRTYFEDLLEYRRVLKQRNRLLTEARDGTRVTEEVLSPWTRSLIHLGARIVMRRRDFVEGFRASLSPVFQLLTGNKEEVGVQYLTRPVMDSCTDEQMVAQALAEETQRCVVEEFRRGSSLVGPHRDEVLLTIDGRSVQAYASQGQQKTLLLAMKIAEFDHLREKVGDAPILLLDDLFGELDAGRSERVIGVISTLGQSIITATGDTPFKNLIHWNAQNRRFAVESGTCRPW